MNEKDGSRYSDEDQQNRYAGDTGLSFTADMTGLRLQWGGGRVNTVDRAGTLIGGGEQP